MSENIVAAEMLRYQGSSQLFIAYAVRYARPRKGIDFGLAGWSSVFLASFVKVRSLLTLLVDR